MIMIMMENSSPAKNEKLTTYTKCVCFCQSLSTGDPSNVINHSTPTHTHNEMSNSSFEGVPDPYLQTMNVPGDIKKENIGRVVWVLQHHACIRPLLLLCLAPKKD